jgi:hypothetical protein
MLPVGRSRTAAQIDQNKFLVAQQCCTIVSTRKHGTHWVNGKAVSCGRCVRRVGARWACGAPLVIVNNRGVSNGDKLGGR